MGRPKIYHREDVQNFANIPELLKQSAQWVCWRSEQRENQKAAKIPITPGLGLPEARINDPLTWRPFNEAIAYFKKEENLLGIGFVFSISDQFTGIDIDDCRDPATEEITSTAGAIIQTFDSYTEISPSGTGVKIFIIGEAPGQHQRRGGIEIYSHSRYFTVTGQHLRGTPKTVNHRQGPLADLYKQIFGSKEKFIPSAPTTDTLLEKVQKITDVTIIELASNENRFKSLWSGDISGHSSHSEADFALCCRLAYWTRGDAERMDRLFRMSGLMRPKWLRVSATTIERAIAKETRRWDPTASGRNPTVKNDLFNADLFSELFEDKFAFIKDWEEWISWDGSKWERNAKSKLFETAGRAVSDELKRRALDAPIDVQTKEMNWAVKVATSGSASSIEFFAKALMAIDSTALDKKPLYLACENGTLNLSTGTLQSPNSLDYITRRVPIAYDATAKCPRFEEFLHEVMLGDEEMVSYLWRVLGYCLTGETREHVFFILHGDGLNGKSTFVDVLKAMMGNYAQSARFQSFLSRGNSLATSANDDIAHMAGARVVVALEADEAARLDAALVKNLTGGDAIRARYLYGREFEFKPQLKLFLVSNYVPRIEDTSYAIWRRVHYIPFYYKVPEDKLDLKLPLKLYGELEGILTRTAQGCLDWQKQGLKAPAKVTKAVEQLRRESDTVGTALEDLIEKDLSGQVRHADLLKAISQWYEQNNYRYAPRTHQLLSYMRRRGEIEKRGHANQLYWLGIRLRNKVYSGETVDMEL
jgi:putative DNA primase/helicase